MIFLSSIHVSVLLLTSRQEKYVQPKMSRVFRKTWDNRLQSFVSLPLRNANLKLKISETPTAIFFFLHQSEQRIRFYAIHIKKSWFKNITSWVVAWKTSVVSDNGVTNRRQIITFFSLSSSVDGHTGAETFGAILYCDEKFIAKSQINIKSIGIGFEFFKVTECRKLLKKIGLFLQ